ncbi:hypothetical protein KSF_060060 [Reticulibacter mediterranei]|uniref:Uncharacterized protein n=1 Tax=Reticulibacter mediterranei TaxID=2778369 RepID=A0A8J3ILD3_9CHLR|nr:hypothetical protein KSF_060060 [Reticulibacter mediterranei]
MSCAKTLSKWDRKPIDGAACSRSKMEFLERDSHLLYVVENKNVNVDRFLLVIYRQAGAT